MPRSLPITALACHPNRPAAAALHAASHIAHQRGGTAHLLQPPPPHRSSAVPARKPQPARAQRAGPRPPSPLRTPIAISPPMAVTFRCTARPHCRPPLRFASGAGKAGTVPACEPRAAATPARHARPRVAARQGRASRAHLCRVASIGVHPRNPERGEKGKLRNEKPAHQSPRLDHMGVVEMILLGLVLYLLRDS